jgi:transcription initiation factor TFIIIB Brf1 subunit/transcription initiation factor TFIIB
MKCENCKCENTLVFDTVQNVIACNICGLVVDDNMFVKEKIDSCEHNTISVIRFTMNTILNDCLPLFHIHKNVEKVLKRKMLIILKSNKELGKLNNVQSIVFTLLIHAIRELKIPLNKKKVNEEIQKYVSMNLMLKGMNNIKL